jgi:hypothetical protein
MEGVGKDHTEIRKIQKYKRRRHARAVDATIMAAISRAAINRPPQPYLPSQDCPKS